VSRQDDARRIFHQALAACSIPAAFDRCFPIDTAEYARVYAIAIGKAALPMLAALAARVPLAGGVCCAPTLPAAPLSGVAYFTGGHPLPNEDSFATAHAALALLGALGPRDLVVFLISGGGSAMCELPLDARISLADTRVLYQALVGSGATIAEINTIRKHFSAVKGGRLAAAAGAAARVSLLVSDVAPRYLDALASGPTLPDTSTVAACRALLDRYGLYAQLPPTVARFFADPALPETPRLAPAPVATLLSSEDLLAAARAEAQHLGYAVVIDNDCDDWDYAEAARHLLARFRQAQSAQQRVCLLSAGEVTVKLGAASGAGGRNQQFALACALAGLHENEVVLSAGSDGIDGTSPAAGALVDGTTVRRAQAQGLDTATALAAFDAYPLFQRLGDALLTGPTHNNLRDLRILLA
jgi:glycerate 2-kinase